MNIRRLSDVDVRGKKVFIRADLNVPQDDAGSDHRRHAHPRVGPGHPRRALARRCGDGDVAPRTSHRRRVLAGRLARPGRGAAVELLGQPVPLVRDWVDGGDWHARLAARRGRAARELPVQPRREEGRRVAGPQDGRALRRLRERRVRYRASRGGDDARHREVRAGRVRRAVDGRGGRGADAGARESAATARGDRRRSEGLDQAHDAASARRKGRRAHRRRRHREHVHPRGRRTHRQVARGAGPRRRGEGDPRPVSRARCRCRSTRSWRSASPPTPHRRSRRSRTSTRTT